MYYHRRHTKQQIEERNLIFIFMFLLALISAYIPFLFA